MRKFATSKCLETRGALHKGSLIHEEHHEVAGARLIVILFCTLQYTSSSPVVLLSHRDSDTTSSRSPPPQRDQLAYPADQIFLRLLIIRSQPRFIRCGVVVTGWKAVRRWEQRIKSARRWGW